MVGTDHVGSRRWASVFFGLFLAFSVCLVAKMNGFDATRSVALQNVEEDTQIHDLQSKVSKLMAEVRKAGKDAEMDANKRDTLAMELASDSGYAHAAKPVLNPLRAEEIADELREQIASEDHDVKNAEKKRKALQSSLDKDLNLLAKAQTKAFYKKEAEMNERAQHLKPSKAVMAPAKQQKLASRPKGAKGALVQPSDKTSALENADAAKKVAALEDRVQALTSALAALRRLKQTASTAGAEGELYLAKLGQKLLSMPAVQQVLAQSLSDKDLTIAEQIAASLGQNFTANAPVDPKIMAEV